MSSDQGACTGCGAEHRRLMDKLCAECREKLGEWRGARAAVDREIAEKRRGARGLTDEYEALSEMEEERGLTAE